MASVVKGRDSRRTPATPPEAVEARDTTSTRDKPANISELHEKHALPWACHACTRSFVLPFPWGNPLFIAMAITVLVAGGFAIWCACKLCSFGVNR